MKLRQIMLWVRRLPSVVIVVACAGLYVLVGGLLLLWVPAALLNNWLPGSTIDDQGKVLGVAAQIVLFGLGGVIAIVGVSLSVLRHQQELAAAERDRERQSDDRERELRARFVTAVDLLSADRPIKRTAALYALGALADDWHAFGRLDEVQVCVHVICGYLRAPSGGSAKRTPLEEAEVKRTGFSLINAHLNEYSPHPWTTLKIDLSGLLLDQALEFHNICIESNGELLLDAMTVNTGGSILLQNVEVAALGRLSLDHATLTEGVNLDLINLEIGDGGVASFDYLSVDKGAKLLFITPSISTRGRLSFDNARVDNGSVALDTAAIESDGIISIYSSAIGNSGTLSFLSPMISHGGEIRLGNTSTRPGGAIYLGGAAIRDGLLELTGGAEPAEDGQIELPDGTRLRLTMTDSY